MSSSTSAEALSASFNARYPVANQPIEIFASADPGTLDNVEAFGVTNYSTFSGKLQYVKAEINFMVAGTIIRQGDYVQVTEDDAKALVRMGRAVLATDEEVAKSQKAGK